MGARVTEMPDDIQIRQAEPADYENVKKIHYLSWRQSYAGIMPPFALNLFDQQSWDLDAYTEAVGRAGWTMRLAESDGKLVGMSIFGPQPGDPDHLEIEALYVAVDNQRRGVGGLLLDHALSSQPAQDVVLWCAEKNYRARGFYEKKGFRLDGRTLVWKPMPGVVEAPQVGYRLYRVAT